ncbi:DUF58 domain-containing protein [Limibaculum sp. M0105]|uniref:DUF58 domain-containing protein n=1 Tax=Thermohalobaculum xanthum TaxID=2753746 RepID=A0A8J7SIJ3_9RHOB|nr:DUF58 domain-containing protein [Thermohalobaculum xanthum]MBK0400370.1 DUF58 domain-containing protein [Thermohalobaculum xanthum]
MAEPASRASRDRAGWLRRDAERVSGSLPALLVEAERLVASVATGVHGRRQAGPGETFWQYRAAQPGDALSQIDWRRSARSDRLYIREMEWEAAETVLLWVDRARSMQFRSDASARTKAERAALLALSVAVLLSRGGERYGLIGTEAEQPRTGERQLQRMAGLLTAPVEPDAPDYGAPVEFALPRSGRIIFFSDFMGPREQVLPALRRAAGQGIGGVYVQILDPVEEEFPFIGRTRFESVARAVRHETDQAAALKDRYRQRLAERRDELDRVARAAGWQLLLHRTDESPRRALLRLHAFIGGGR